jgi:hypothetical protein
VGCVLSTAESCACVAIGAAGSGGEFAVELTG